MDPRALPCGQPMSAASAEFAGLLERLDSRVQQLKGNSSEPPEMVQKQQQQRQQKQLSPPPQRQQLNPPCRRALLGTFGAVLGRSPSTARCQSRATIGLDLQMQAPMLSSRQRTSPHGGGGDKHMNKFTAVKTIDGGGADESAGAELWARMEHMHEEVANLRNQLDEQLRKLGEQQDQAEAEIEELRVRLLDILTPDMLRRSERVGRLRQRLELLRNGVGSEQAECVKVLSALLSRMEGKRLRRLAPSQHVSTEVQVNLPLRSHSKEPTVPDLVDGSSVVASAPVLHGIGVNVSPTQRQASPGIQTARKQRDGDKDRRALRRGRGQQQQRQVPRDVVAQFKGAGVSADLGGYSSRSRHPSRPSTPTYWSSHSRRQQQHQLREQQPLTPASRMLHGDVYVKEVATALGDQWEVASSAGSFAVAPSTISMSARSWKPSGLVGTPMPSTAREAGSVFLLQ